MSPIRIRLLTISVVTLLVAGLLAVIGVGIGPATAQHLAGRTIQASPEIGSGTLGSPITVTVQLSEGTTAGSGPIQIDAEIVADADGNTPASPDTGCTVPFTPPATGASACSFAVNSTGFAESLVRIWIDHDNKNTVGEGGITELDGTEGRMAHAYPDTNPNSGASSPEAVLPSEADCLLPEDYAVGEDPTEECATLDDDAAEPGSVDEPDVSDVILLRWESPERLDCDAASGTDSPTVGEGNNAVFTCKVVNAQGGVITEERRIEAENVSNVDGQLDGNGANDPDDAAGGNADYFEPAPAIGAHNHPGCITDGGECQLTIEPIDGQAGPAVICAWIDNESSNDNVFNPNGDASDGGDCDLERVNDPERDDPTDSVRILWSDEAPEPTRLDLAPESGSVNAGGTQSIQAQVYDQFGQPSGAGIDVRFELTDPSPSDTDGSTPTSIDKTCETDANGKCGVSLSSNTAGTDVVCGWFGTVPSAMTNTTCEGETTGDANDVDRIDVVTRSWTTPPPPPPDPLKTQGYVLVGGDGGIFAYGAAEFHGSTGGMKLNQPIIGIAYMPGGKGYWLVAKDGGVFTFGAAKFHGSMGDKTLNAPVLGIESTPTGNGYWLFAADGGIFSFGDASFHGSTGNMKLNSPVVGMGVTELGDGYWLVASDGGVFSFDAPFHGSTGNMKLNEPVFDMAPAKDDQGYWLVARDGGVFTFGKAGFYGSATNVPGRATVVGMGDTPTGEGYWIGDVNGKVMPFGDAKFFGDRSTTVENAPMVAFASVQPKEA